MQYIPSLVMLHLIDTKGLPMVATLLVSLYNLEVSTAPLFVTICFEKLPLDFVSITTTHILAQGDP